MRISLTAAAEGLCVGTTRSAYLVNLPGAGAVLAAADRVVQGRGLEGGRKGRKVTESLLGGVCG